MDEFLRFFVELTSLQKVIWIVSCLLFAWILEKGIPMVKHDYNKIRHDAKNLFFMLFLVVINALVGIATVGLYFWVEQNEIGLLHLFEFPIWLELLLAFLFLDMVSQYWAHYALHKIKFAWKMHMVHHADTKVDATTGTRMHPFEYILRETFVTVTVVAIGIPVAYYAFYRICSVFFSYWTHANIKLPDWFDRTLSYVFITPKAHKFHHHFERPWTDSNFGNIFSVWDRIFGTYVYADEDDIKYGLDVLEDDRDEDLKYQMGLPFNNKVKTDY